MLSLEECQQIESILLKSIKYDCRILNHAAVSGGDINQTYKLSTSAGSFFLKKNSAKAFPGMFEAEGFGLSQLRAQSFFTIPDVVQNFELSNSTYLLMKFLETGSPKPDFWEDFGHKLAMMHQRTQGEFGLDQSNYIGSLQQKNDESSNWEDFFIEMRLEPLIKMAVDERLISKMDLPLFNKLFALLQDFFPKEAPAFLHGDLWNGNFSIGADGYACLFDPAVYFGHREMDLGMTRLFGGFDTSMYESYHHAYPLESGWERRLQIANVYPLLVHLNLFGISYYSQVRSAIQNFI